MSLLVTIAIPTYNRAQANLGKVITAALAQDYDNLEVIVSDNCSQDNTREVVCGFTDPRLRYVRHAENIGATKNFESCLEAAKGDYFLLLHDDDLIDVDFTSSCVDTIDDADRVGFVKTGTRTIDEHGNLIRSLPNQVDRVDAEAFFHAWFTSRTSVFLCSTLFQTKALIATGGLSSIHGLFQDGMALARISRAWEPRHVGAPKASFRMHSGQRTHAAGLMRWCEEFEDFLRFLAVDHPGVSKTTVAEGSRFFRRLMLGRVARLDRRLARRVFRYRVGRFFDRVDIDIGGGYSA